VVLRRLGVVTIPIRRGVVGLVVVMTVAVAAAAAAVVVMTVVAVAVAVVRLGAVVRAAALVG
jgi:hypothetical protein